MPTIPRLRDKKRPQSYRKRQRQSMYSEYRGRGEWFNLSTNQVHYIIKYFGMKITNKTKLNEFYETDLEPFLNPKY